MSSSFRKNIIYNVCLSLTNVIFPLITAPYVSRVLGPDNLGLSNFAITYVSYFVIFATLGINTYGVREIARNKNNIKEQSKIFNELFTICLISTFVTSVVYILTVLSVQNLRNNLLMFVVSGIVLITQPFNVEWFFMGIEKFGFITLRSIVIKSVSFCLLFLVVRSDKDILLYVTLSVFSTILNQLWNFYELRKNRIRLRIDLSGFSKHIKALWVFLCASIATSAFNYVDVIMLGFFSEIKQVAFYSSASHIAKVLVALTSSVAIVGLPRISNLYSVGKYGEIKSLINKSISLISFLAFPIVISLILISPTFVPCFYGLDYKGAIIPLQILACIVALIGFSYIFSSMALVSMGKEKLAVRNTIIGALFNIISNAIIIPSLGAIGAAISSVIAEFIICILNLYCDYKSYSFFYINWISVIKNFMLSLILIPIFIILKDNFENWHLVIIYAFLGGFTYLLSQFIVRNEVIINLVKTRIRV